MSFIKEIYIYRHGETDFNQLGIVQGSGVDAALNATGLAQAKAFFEAYQHLDFQVVLTSALRRTQQTAAPFIRKGIRWQQFPEINEISWGVHEGKNSEPKLRKEYRQLMQAWKEGRLDQRIEGGESALEMAERLQRFIEHLKEREEQRILVCSHGRAMRCLMCLLDGKDLRKMDQYHHSNTGLYKVNYQAGRFDFELYNDTAHLTLLTS